MRKMLFTLVWLSVFVACATGNRTQTGPQGFAFETGKSRKAVMGAIVQVATDDGFTVNAMNHSDGRITFKTREMLDGVLSQKTEGQNWDVQTKRSTFNHLIQFSADVSPQGVVKLKTLVMVSGINGPVDTEKSEKLARYYEKRIIQALRRRPPRLVLWVTVMTVGKGTAV